MRRRRDQAASTSRTPLRRVNAYPGFHLSMSQMVYRPDDVEGSQARIYGMMVVCLELRRKP